MILGGMKKTMLTLIALALLVFLIVLASRPDEPEVASVPDPSRGPSFEVHLVRPFAHRAFFGLGRLVGFDPDGDLWFDHRSRGAEAGRVGHDRLELRAEGWDLLIATDGEGRIAPGTRLVSPMTRDGQVLLRCRPADRPVGHLRTTTRADTGELSGSFLVKLSTCENARSGKPIDWPSAPLTVRGSFTGLPGMAP